VATATVRRVRPEDAARVRALRLEMLADSPLAFLERIEDAAARPHTEFQQRTAERATSPENAAFIAECGPRVVGHAGAWVPPGSAGTTMLYAVYVTPHLRGHGVLGRLVEIIAAWSREGGRPLLALEVVTTNERAIRAYERLGFTDTGQRAPHPTLPFLTEALMTRAAAIPDAGTARSGNGPRRTPRR
jgi:ribosomal protein S18 acetylase RimI-like enzyme